jgi:hypothetical protein
MQKLFLFIMAALLVIPLYSQQKKNIKRKHSYEADYLEMSEKQKKIASVMLGGGVVLIVAPALILLNSELGDDNLPRKAVVTLTLMSVGGLSVLGSIPLFTAAKRNRKMALTGSTGVKMEYLNDGLNIPGRKKFYPAVSFRLNLLSGIRNIN